jgi:UDP-N-acetylmuramoyl-tripeptide--D-alanyl-D-alanine ligase
VLALTLKEVAEVCAGRLDGADPEATVRRVVIDSRASTPETLFVALRGENADGHDFAGDAFARGAVAVLAERTVSAPAVIVEDTVAALGRLAAAVRLRLRATVVAITGSSGKTCTKDFTAAAVATQRRVVASEASFNNEIGVPLTVLAAEESTDVLIAEIGSRGAGHIAALAPVLRPDVAVVTNVGPAHIGLFGSLDAIVEAKAELVEAIGSDGIAVLNADDPLVMKMMQRARGEVVTFGETSAADVRATGVELDEHARASFQIEAGSNRARVSLPVPGEHMVPNALAAAAVAMRLGVPLAKAAEGIASCAVPRWRMQVCDAPGGARILNDAYNANPASMEAALKSLARLGRHRRTWAVLGPMAELGAASASEHDRIGRLVVRLGIDRLVTIDAGAEILHEAARHEGMSPEEARLVPDVEAAVALLRREIGEGDVVLVKASRAAGLERVAQALIEGQ